MVTKTHILSGKTIITREFQVGGDEDGAPHKENFIENVPVIRHVQSLSASGSGSGAQNLTAITALPSTTTAMSQNGSNIPIGMVSNMPWHHY